MKNSLKTRAAIKESHTETKAENKNPQAKGIARGLSLPGGLDDWHLLGDKWFENNIYDFFADLPTHPWEDHKAFARGAFQVVDRLIQKTVFEPFSVLKAGRPRGKINLLDNKNTTHIDFGVIAFVAKVSLHAPESRVVNGFKKFLAAERKKRGVTIVSARPSKMDHLQRDLVVYVLDREGWDIASIQIQLEYMKSCPFPPKVNPKVFVRKVRARFKKIEEEIAGPTIAALA